MKETVTYVEMTARSQLIPAAPVPGLTLGPVDHGPPVIPDLLARIGAAYGWKQGDSEITNGSQMVTVSNRTGHAGGCAAAAAGP